MSCFLKLFGWRAPSAENLFNTGMELFQQGRHQEAFDSFTRAATLNHVAAILNVASMYNRGSGVAQDKTRAFELYERASKLGDLAAKCNMAFMHYVGEGVREDEAIALKLYQEMEEYPPALYGLGCIFFNKPFAKNKAKALEYLQRFIKMGTEDLESRSKAFYMIGRIYETGSNGGVANRPLAMEFYRRGALLDDQDCIARLSL